MATTQHYLWAAGHGIILLSSLRCLLAMLLFRGTSLWWFRTSFTGALLSYAIVCQKSLGPIQPNLQWIQKALLDENAQYLLLALFWWASKPIPLALVPYTIFSLFHVLTFVRTTVMPHVFPQGPPAAAGGQPTPHPFAKKLQLWVKANYDTAMKVVAFAELAIMARVLLGAVTLQNSLLMPVFYAHFLRGRFYQSKFTQNAVYTVDAYIENFIHKPNTHPIIVRVWDNGKLVLKRWAGATLVPQAAPPNGAGARRQ